MLFLPGVCKFAQGEAEALASKIGTAGAFGNNEAAELDDELEAVGASHGIPTDPGVAVFEMLGGPSPTEDGDKLVAAVFGVLLVNALPKNMSGRTTGFEVVFGVEHRSELADLQWLGRGTNVEGGIGLNPRCKGYRGSHDTPTMQNRGIMSSRKAAISER